MSAVHLLLLSVALGAWAPERPHPLHLSTTAIAIDETAVFLRVRMFKNDLEGALAAADGRDSLTLAATAEHDAMFLDYFGERFELRFDGASVTPEIVASGEDLTTRAGDERIWWVELRYAAPAGFETLGIRAAILYERFDDQRNIVRVLHTGTSRQKTLYFAAPDDDWSEVRLG